MTIAAPVAQTLSPGEISAYHHNGYHLARELFTPAEITAIRDTFMTINAHGPVEGLSETTHYASPTGYDPSDPLKFYPRMMHPHRHPDKPVGPLALRTMLDPRIQAVLSDLLADEPIAAQSMFYFKPPGARGQDFHQDNFYLRVQPGSCMAAWTAIDDCDEENGTMMVVPTTHTMAIACPEKSDSSIFFTRDHVDIPQGLSLVPCLMKAGDVLFFNGSLIHGSYPNTSKTRFRRAFICHYIPKACLEVSHWYRPLLTFDGQEATRQDATGGGPCGTPHDEPKGPH